MKVTRTEQGLVVEGKMLPVELSAFDNLKLGETVYVEVWASGMYEAQLGRCISNDTDINACVTRLLRVLSDGLELTYPEHRPVDPVLARVMAYVSKGKAFKYKVLPDGRIAHENAEYANEEEMLMALEPIEQFVAKGGRRIQVWGPVVRINNGDWQ